MKMLGEKNGNTCTDAGNLCLQNISGVDRGLLTLQTGFLQATAPQHRWNDSDEMKLWYELDIYPVFHLSYICVSVLHTGTAVGLVGSVFSASWATSALAGSISGG